MAKDIRTRFAGAATVIGTSVEQYLQHIAAGEKWCCGQKHWAANEDFNKNRASADGLAPVCRPYARAGKRNAKVSRQDLVCEALESLRGAAK
jgi:hypothetical protein